MKPLIRVTAALREAHAQMPQRDQIRDLAYLLDVDPFGSESLVLYVKLGKDSSPSATEKRALEALMREKLQEKVGYQVFFRWLSEDEDPDARVTTKSGLMDAPVSALH